MTRSIPMDKAWDDAMVAYAQNGEAVRPEQGYPARLFLPGWEGNANVKWLRRLELADRPFMTREEASKYTDTLPDGTARQFSFVFDARSIITSPAYPESIQPLLGRDSRHRLVRTRSNHASRDQHRSRGKLADGAASDTGIAEGARAISTSLAVGWLGDGDREPGYRRDRLRAARP